MNQDILSRILQRGEEIGISLDDINSRYNCPALTNGQDFSLQDMLELASLLRVSEYWLLDGSEDPNKVLVSARHSYNHRTSQIVEHDWDSVPSILAKPSMAYLQIDDLDINEIEHCNFDDNPVLVASFIRKLLIEKSGVNFLDNFPKSIYDSLGIEVFVYPFSDERTLINDIANDSAEAYSSFLNGHFFIAMNITPNAYRANFSLAHEIGHIISQRLSSYNDVTAADNSFEAWPNAFASALLLPEESLLAFDWDVVSKNSIAHMIFKYGISRDVLKNKLKKMKLSNERTDYIFMIYRNTNDLIRDEIQDDNIEKFNSKYISPIFPERIFSRHIQMFRNRKSTGRIISWMTGKEIDVLISELQS